MLVYSHSSWHQSKVSNKNDYEQLKSCRLAPVDWCSLMGDWRWGPIASLIAGSSFRQNHKMKSALLR